MPPVQLKNTHYGHHRSAPSAPADVAAPAPAPAPAELAGASLDDDPVPYVDDDPADPDNEKDWVEDHPKSKKKKHR